MKSNILTPNAIKRSNIDDDLYRECLGNVCCEKRGWRAMRNVRKFIAAQPKLYPSRAVACKNLCALTSSTKFLFGGKFYVHWMKWIFGGSHEVFKTAQIEWKFIFMSI